MAKTDAGFGLAALALGLGIATGAMLHGAAERRSMSIERMRTALATRGLKLVSAELGRTGIGPAWVLTIELPSQGIVVATTQLSQGQDPYDNVTCDGVVDNVAGPFNEAVG